MQFSGMPQRPKPPSMITAPSVMSAMAAAAFLNVFFISVYYQKKLSCSNEARQITEKQTTSAFLQNGFQPFKKILYITRASERLETLPAMPI
jgi:hypothetical protein